MPDIFRLLWIAVFRRRNIGIVYQFYNLIPTLTAEENISLLCLLDKRKPDYDKLRKILEMIGLTGRNTYRTSFPRDNSSAYLWTGR